MSRCPDGAACKTGGCTLVHPTAPQRSNKKKKCHRGAACTTHGCTFWHPKCPQGSACKKAGCQLWHRGKSNNPKKKGGGSKKGRKRSPRKGKQSQPCNAGAFRPRNDNPASRRGPCTCRNWDCTLLHGDSRQLCLAAALCADLDCTAIHPQDRVVCLSPRNCGILLCQRPHHRDRDVCTSEGRCKDYDCTSNHPSGRPRRCKFAEKCIKSTCRRLHPGARAVECGSGMFCADFACALIHPDIRSPPCRFGAECSQASCLALHPDDWDPDDASVMSGNSFSSHHPRQSSRSPRSDGGRSRSRSRSRGRKNSRKKGGQQGGQNPARKGRKKQDLKDQAQRDAYRTKNALPIYSSKDSFLELLLKHKVVVVTAETGSGKTTQLPQYCAEHPAFAHGKVYCTQPRAVAARSIADRVAQEFDGASTGFSVGFGAGGTRVRGSKINLITDATLISLAQRDRKLDSISVLIIDEAHERSLNTDVVLGIAKLLQAQRDDFYVVIASATIEPKPFMDFFRQGATDPTLLNVLGNAYPTTCTHEPIEDDRDVVRDKVVSRTASALEEFEEGHCLVFLPGSRDVDNCIKKFKALKRRDWVALPLYGSLSQEEQQKVLSFDDNDGSLRMIVFCTNVAETSLTVPNVRLVIDTGLAKEARYDVERRMTVLEQVYVSRSSATQRKGRAGRTAPGHCIRLYGEDALTRESITPEILRSSLDHVVLQLCRLSHDPATFPFIDRPNSKQIAASVALLIRIGFLSAEGALTRRGSLLGDMPFDPRFSHFVVRAHELFNGGKLAAVIAGVLTAPGSVFFMGGAAKRKEAKSRIQELASDSASDLLLLANVYLGWLQAGACDEARCCQTCRKKVNAGRLRINSGCYNCRRNHAQQNDLNNKVLGIVLSNVNEVQKYMDRGIREGSVPKAGGGQAAESTPKAHIVGRCLLEAFPEQLCQLLVPANPSAGVHVIDSKLKGKLSNTCTLMQTNASCVQTGGWLLCMAVQKTPQGDLYLDHTHPLVLSWMPATVRQICESQHSLNMHCCYSQTNRSLRYSKSLQRELEIAASSANRLQFAVCTHANATLSVFAPKEVQAEIERLAKEHDQRLFQSDLEYEQTVVTSKTSTTVSSGLLVQRVEIVGNARKIRFNSAAWVGHSITNKRELKTWLASLNVTDEDIKWTHLTKKNEATVVFRNDEVADRVRTLVTAAGNGLAEHELSQEDRWGRQLQLSFPRTVTEDEVEAIIKHGGVDPLRVRVLYNNEAQFKLRICKVPEDASVKAQIKAICTKHGASQVSGKPGTMLLWANGLPSLLAVQAACAQLQATFAFLQLSNKVGRGASALVSVEFLKDEEAQQVLAALLSLGHPVSASAKNGVSYSKYFDLPSMIRNIEARFSVQSTIKVKNQGKRDERTEVYWTSRASTMAVKQAAQRLDADTKPLKVLFRTADRRAMATELRITNRLNDWATKLKLSVECFKDRSKRRPGKQGQIKELGGLTLHGSKVSQGQFMRKMADHYDSFCKRFQPLELGDAVASQFSYGRRGVKKLDDLQQELGQTCRVYYSAQARALHVVAHADDTPEMQRTAESVSVDVLQRVKGLLRSLDSSQPVNASKSVCGCCGNTTHLKLRICGHRMCENCMNETIRSQITTGEGAVRVDCLTCNTLVSILDLRDHVSPELYQRAIAVSALRHVRAQPAHLRTLFICPNDQCRGISAHVQGYACCASCGLSVCADCGTCNDELHEGRSCSEYQAARRAPEFSVAEILADAQKFAAAEWPSDLPPISKILDNPGLADGCPSVQKFCRALQAMGGLKALKNSIFSWHGTAWSGIEPICHYGLDPGRRSGQVHGPGEYFGVTANVSKGYAKGCQTLLVCLLLKPANKFKLVNNFCYVLDNPRDDSLAYCLPVLVVHYDPSPRPLMFVRDTVVALPRFGSGAKANAPPVVIAPPKKGWSAPFKWCWKNDKGEFAPYTDEINWLLAEHFELASRGQAPMEFTTPPIIRYLDDRPQKYVINFSACTQQNATTKFRRHIKRKKIEMRAGRGGMCWEFQDARGWKRYESLAQGHISKAFIDYVDGAGSCKCSISFPGRPEKYTLDFDHGTQTNQTSGTTRAIRHVEVGMG